MCLCIPTVTRNSYFFQLSVFSNACPSYTPFLLVPILNRATPQTPPNLYMTAVNPRKTNLLMRNEIIATNRRLSSRLTDLLLIDRNFLALPDQSQEENPPEARVKAFHKNKKVGLNK